MSKAPDHRTATVDVQTPKLSGRYADESYKLFSKVDVEEASPEEARRLRDKYIEWILPFLCVGYDLISIEKQGQGDPPKNSPWNANQCEAPR